MESSIKALTASDALTQKVIGEAMYVHRILGFGFSESVYHNSLKAVASLIPAYEAQLVNYLTATKIPVGLLLNFGPKSVEIKRRVLGYVPAALREEDASYLQASESL